MRNFLILDREMSKHNQIAVIIISILIINAKSIQVIQDRNSNPIENSTTLYPVEKNVFIKSETVKIKDNKIKSTNLNREITNWNINTTFVLPNDNYEGEEDEAAVNKHTNDNFNHGRNSEEVPKPNLFSFPTDERSEEDWEKGKIDSDKTKNNAAASKYTGKDKIIDQSTQKKEFKPSPHLSSYLDTLEDSPLRSFTSFPKLEKNPSPSFYESQAQYEHSTKFPQDFVAFPYKYENNGIAQIANAWNFHGLQSKPTDEAPVSIPAGGLYGNPDVLKDKPIYYEDGEDFSLDVIHNFKDGSHLKKRSNPWKNLLHLVTALLPVGLIISALTPSIITVQNTGTDLQKFNRPSRRSDADQSIPAVSEQCKRRLLCEIHSERNYQSTATPYRPKRCYKIRCEDPQAVSRVLNWLLTYHKSQDGRSRGYT